MTGRSPRTAGDLVDLLDQVPGIGRDAAQLILAEIGTDMAPFATSWHWRRVQS